MGGSHGICQLLQHCFGGGQVDTGIGDTLTVGELPQIHWNRLISSHQMALKHHPHQVLAAAAHLVCHLAEHLPLAAVILVGIAVAAIHHHPGRQLVGRQAAGRRRNRFAVVVAALLTAPQHQVAIGVACGGYDRGHTLLVDAQEVMGPGRRLHGVDGRGHAAVGAVFEADRHRQAGGHLPVGLALGGAGADSRPADQVGDVLGHDRIQQLSGRRQTHLGHVQQQFPGDAQARVDVVAAV